MCLFVWQKSFFSGEKKKNQNSATMVVERTTWFASVAKLADGVLEFESRPLDQKVQGVH